MKSSDKQGDSQLESEQNKNEKSLVQAFGQKQPEDGDSKGFSMLALFSKVKAQGKSLFVFTKIENL